MQKKQLCFEYYRERERERETKKDQRQMNIARAEREKSATLRMKNSRRELKTMPHV